MSEQQFSDLAVIAMYYSEGLEVDVDEICQQAFVKAHLRRLFQASLFSLNRRVKKETNNYRCCTVLLVFNNSVLNLTNLYL